MNFIAYLLAVIFLIISLLHIYWLFGGRWGYEQVMPKDPFNPNNLSFFTSKVISFLTFLVALVFLGFSLITFSKTYGLKEESDLLKYFFYMISLLFSIRTVGDFKYVGLSKRIKGTEFSKFDNYLFIPLCAFIAISSLILALSSWNLSMKERSFTATDIAVISWYSICVDDVKYDASRSSNSNFFPIGHVLETKSLYSQYFVTLKYSCTMSMPLYILYLPQTRGIFP